MGGTQCSPANDPTFQKAWGDMPSDGEIVITKDRIVVTRKRAPPSLEITSQLVDLDRKGSIPDEKEGGALYSSGVLKTLLGNVDSGGRTSIASDERHSVTSVIHFPKSDSMASLEAGDTVRRVGTDRSDESVVTDYGGRQSGLSIGKMDTSRLANMAMLGGAMGSGSPVLTSPTIPETESVNEPEMVVIRNEQPAVGVVITALERDENAEYPRFPKMRRQNDSMLSLPGAPTYDDGEESDAEWAAHERHPTTLFGTLNTPLPSADDEDLEAQWEAQDIEAVVKSQAKLEAEEKTQEKDRPEKEIAGASKKPSDLASIKLPEGGLAASPKVRKKKKLVREGSMPIQNERGENMLKKLATRHEQQGKMEMQVFFTRKKKGQDWPHLTVTVGEDWPWIKVMRKSLATLQKNLKKGDRDGTHDWVFGYHANKDIRKIRKELKVLLGNRGLEFYGGLLKKPVNVATTDFVNKIWILPKAAKKGRTRSRSPNPRGRLKTKADQRKMAKSAPNSPQRKRGTTVRD